MEKHSRWKKTRRETKRKPDHETKEGETKKKKRPFNEKWTAGGEWLLYEPRENVMYCTDCRMYGGDKMKGVSFVVRTNNFKVETIKDHEMSTGLRGCMETKREKT